MTLGPEQGWVYSLGSVGSATIEIKFDTSKITFVDGDLGFLGGANETSPGHVESAFLGDAGVGDNFGTYTFIKGGVDNASLEVTLTDAYDGSNYFDYPIGFTIEI